LHLLVAHQPEPDLQVGIAEAEPIGYPAQLLGVGIVSVLDPAIIGAARHPECVIDVFRVDVTVKKVVEQGF
jgi:hypothetical protein